MLYDVHLPNVSLGSYRTESLVGGGEAVITQETTEATGYVAKRNSPVVLLCIPILANLRMKFKVLLQDIK